MDLWDAYHFESQSALNFNEYHIFLVIYGFKLPPMYIHPIGHGCIKDNYEIINETGSNNKLGQVFEPNKSLTVAHINTHK